MRQVTAMASPPSFLIAATTSSHGSRLRPEITTFAPASAKISAIARPMPRDEPVTTATFPVRSKSSFMALALFPHQRVPEDADAGDLDLAHIAVLEVFRRALSAHPHHVARVERQVLRHAAD